MSVLEETAIYFKRLFCCEPEIPEDIKQPVTFDIDIYKSTSVSEELGEFVDDDVQKTCNINNEEKSKTPVLLNRNTEKFIKKWFKEKSLSPEELKKKEKKRKTKEKLRKMAQEERLKKYSVDPQNIDEKLNNEILKMLEEYSKSDEMPTGEGYDYVTDYSYPQNPKKIENFGYDLISEFNKRNGLKNKSCTVLRPRISKNTSKIKKSKSLSSLEAYKLKNNDININVNNDYNKEIKNRKPFINKDINLKNIENKNRKNKEEKGKIISIKEYEGDTKERFYRKEIYKEGSESYISLEKNINNNSTSNNEIKGSPLCSNETEITFLINFYNKSSYNNILADKMEDYLKKNDKNNSK